MLTKELIHNTINSLPEKFSLDQLIEEIILIDKIEQGIADANEGRVHTTEQVKEKLKKWLK